MFGPELIRINEFSNDLIANARSAVSKNRAERGFLRRQPRNFAADENTTLVASRRRHFWDFLSISLVAQLSPQKVF